MAPFGSGWNNLLGLKKQVKWRGLGAYWRGAATMAMPRPERRLGKSSFGENSVINVFFKWRRVRTESEKKIDPSIVSQCSCIGFEIKLCDLWAAKGLIGLCGLLWIWRNTRYASQTTSLFTQRSSYRVSPSRFLRLPRPSSHPTSTVAERYEPISRCSKKNSLFTRRSSYRVTPSRFLRLPRPSSLPTSKVAETLQHNHIIALLVKGESQTNAMSETSTIEAWNYYLNYQIYSWITIKCFISFILF